MSTLRANDLQPSLPASIETPAVLNFSHKNGLGDYLTVAADLFRRYFDVRSPFSWQLQEDMESGDEYLELNAVVGGDVGRVLEAYDKFTNEWVRQAPVAARQRIRFSYSLT